MDTTERPLRTWCVNNKQHKNVDRSDATGSDTNLQQQHENTNLRKSFDGSVRGKNGLTCCKYDIKTQTNSSAIKHKIH